MVTLPINGAISTLRPRPVLLNWYTFVYSKSMQFVWRSGIWLTTTIWRCRKPFGQWQRSFQRKLRSHWLKFLRQRHVAVVKQGLGAAIFYFLELHDFKRGQRSGHSKILLGTDGVVPAMASGVTCALSLSKGTETMLLPSCFSLNIDDKISTLPNLVFFLWWNNTRWILVKTSRRQFVKTLKRWQNGRHFAEDIFKHNFLNENVCILNEISLKFVLNGPVDNESALV